MEDVLYNVYKVAYKNSIKQIEKIEEDTAYIGL